MLKQTRREFLKAAGIAGIGVSEVLAGANKENIDTKPSKKKLMSKIRVAQVKVYPEKGNMRANHTSLMNILKDIENNHDVDVVVTPEGFLDGYVSTVQSVTKGDMVKYAINPLTSRYTQAVSNWAKRNKAWFFYGCTRKVADGVYNTALIYNRTGGLVGMYDKP
jgi:predicted amidohydrolase